MAPNIRCPSPSTFSFESSVPSPPISSPPPLVRLHPPFPRFSSSSCFLLSALSISTSFFSLSIMSFILLTWSTTFSFSDTTRPMSSELTFSSSSFLSCSVLMLSLRPVYCFSARSVLDWASSSSVLRPSILRPASALSFSSASMAASLAVAACLSSASSLAALSAPADASTSDRSLVLS